tara:strand:+ start:75 stop:587 length:513 start_codon:yes stop_codon:yes gene_type:complete
MAIQHFFAGPATVTITPRTPGTGALGSPINVGINREAIPIIVTPVMLDVPSDSFGGPDGVPSDVQHMGATASIQLSLTKFEKTAVDSLLDGYYFTGQSPGVLPPFGSLARLSSYYFILTLTSTSRVTEFDFCFVRNGGAYGQGTRYSSYDLQIEAHINEANRTLYEFTLP